MERRARRWSAAAKQNAVGGGGTTLNIPPVGRKAKGKTTKVLPKLFQLSLGNRSQSQQSSSSQNQSQSLEARSPPSSPGSELVQNSVSAAAVGMVRSVPFFQSRIREIGRSGDDAISADSRKNRIDVDPNSFKHIDEDTV